MLPDHSRSCAVLIGTSHYRSPELPPLPAVRQNLDDLQAVLTDPALGWLDPAHCVVAANTRDVRTVFRSLRDSAMAAEDTLFVYFAGHGRVGPRNELFLGLTDTDPDELQVSALAYDLVRDTLNHSPAANRVVILDCCFSGRVVDDMAGDVIGQLEVEGTYVLAATPPNAVALAPAGARHTAFTGMLLELLGNGLPDAPPLLTLGRIHQELVRTAVKRGLPQPRQRGTGTSQNLALARNAVKVDRSAPVVAKVPTPTPPRRRGTQVPWGLALFTVLVAAAMIGLFTLFNGPLLRWNPNYGGSLVVYSPSGRYVIGVTSGPVPVLDHAGHTIAKLGNSPSASRVAISDDGKLAAVAMQDEVKVYDVDREAEVATVPDGRRVRDNALLTRGLSFNKDATLLVADNMVWDLRANRPIGDLPVPDEADVWDPDGPNRVLSARFHPIDPDVLALETYASTRLWNARTLTPVSEPLRHGNSLTGGHVEFSADGTLLSANGALWSLERREKLCHDTDEWDRVIALSPDGQLIVVVKSRREKAYLARPNCLRLSREISDFNDIAFSHDSKWLQVVRSDETETIEVP
ncbi:caspase family protein [Lentzea sp. JNUCC 0626]|uniref:caspase, EACC1-associated type n=1 Tax=Lentzea sp. JNUCC 0626 TaxID=3367513 RepID=UPI003749D3A5